MAKSKKQSKEIKCELFDRINSRCSNDLATLSQNDGCELFERVNANCDNVLAAKNRNNDSWFQIKGIWPVILSIAVFVICMANLALLIWLDKIYLF